MVSAWFYIINYKGDFQEKTYPMYYKDVAFHSIWKVTWYSSHQEYN